MSAVSIQIIGDLLERLFTHAGCVLQHFHKLIDRIDIFPLDNFG